MRTIAFLLFFTLTNQASTLFIGNGGDVFKIQNSFYVRDLVEANAHLKPFFHCSPSTNSETQIDFQKVTHLGLNQNLLVRKICDLDFIYPGFSRIFVAAFNFHSWTLISETLGLLPDDGPLLNSSPDRLQAANRTLFNIRLQNQIWKTLSGEHKIALIAHEIIFSLLKFNCDNTDCTTYKQSARIAREITGLLFVADTYKKNESIAKLKALMLMSFNSNISDLRNWNSSFLVRVTFTNINGEVIFSMEKSDSQSYGDYAVAVCKEHVKHPTVIQLSLTRINYQNFSLKPTSYLTQYGNEYGLQIHQFHSIDSKPIRSIYSETECREKLSKELPTF